MLHASPEGKDNNTLSQVCGCTNRVAVIQLRKLPLIIDINHSLVYIYRLSSLFLATCRGVISHLHRRIAILAVGALMGVAVHTFTVSSDTDAKETKSKRDVRKKVRYPFSKQCQ